MPLQKLQVWIVSLNAYMKYDHAILYLVMVTKHNFLLIRLVTALCTSLLISITLVSLESNSKTLSWFGDG